MAPAAPPVLNAISHINDHLLLSGFGPVSRQKVKADVDTIEALGVSLIVDATNVPRRFCLDGVELMRVGVNDSERADLGPYFHPVADAIHRHHLAGGKALVHCAAGVSRSAALCLAYLVKHEDYSLREAFLFVRERRSIVSPNNGFWRQLIAFESATRGLATVAMRPGLSRDFPDVIFAHLHQ